MTLKPIGTWDLPYLTENIFTGEYDWVEYKGTTWATFCNKNLEEISKYVSAFSNYEGGYLIIGVRESRSGGERPQLDAGIDFRLRNGLKSWLEDVVPNLVKPKLSKLNIQTLATDAQESNGVVIIHIPGSWEAPHQARVGRFYGKGGSKNYFLSTQQILDIANRRKNPVLELTASLHIWKARQEGHIQFCLENTSRVICSKYGIRINSPVYAQHYPLMFESEANCFISDESPMRWHIRKTNKLGSPIFPQDRLETRVPFHIGTGITDLSGKPQERIESDTIDFTVYADSSEPKVFSFKIDDITHIHYEFL